jgi:curved DNA-binding protein CbpA
MMSETEVGGTIGFLTLAGVLKDLFQRRATGELVLANEKAAKKVFFKNGIIIYATSNQEKDRLGDVLLLNGMISQAQFDESGRQVQATGKKQGTLLVQMEALSAKDLFRGLNLQVRSIVLSLFDWDAGTWSFSDVLPPQEEIVTLRLPPAPLVVEGILRRASDTERFHPLWDPETLSLQVHPDPPWVLEDLGIPAVAKKLITCVGRNVPWKELPAAAGMSGENVTALLYALSVFELIETGEPEAATDPPRKAEAASGPEDALPSPEKIRALHEKMGSLNLYQMLRLEPGANTDSVKESYLMLAKEYHPDRFFDSRYEGLKGEITSIFMRVNEAYNVLSNTGRRSEYDRKEIHLQAGRLEKGEQESDSRVAQQQFRKGMETLKAGDAWTAVESFRWAVQLSPRNALYHSWLGAALTATRKRLHEAEEHCKTAIALDYSNPLFYLHLGQVYKTGKLPQKAKKQFETALKLDPKFRQATDEIKGLGSSPDDKGFMGKILGK